MRMFKLVELEYTTRLHSMIVMVVASTGLTSFAFYSDCTQIWRWAIVDSQEPYGSHTSLRSFNGHDPFRELLSINANRGMFQISTKIIVHTCWWPTNYRSSFQPTPAVNRSQSNTENENKAEAFLSGQPLARNFRYRGPNMLIWAPFLYV